MALPNVFEKPAVEQLLKRIDELTPQSQRLWGKMGVAEMLAHLNVSYELVYDNIHPKPNFLMGWVMKTFVKKHIVNEVPYQANIATAPYFIIKDTRDFETEKNRLKNYILRTQELGEIHFAGKESHAFGVLTATEWNNLFYKHLDHHLRQFDV